MTKLVCPHGVDLSYQVETIPDFASENVTTYVKKNECLRCLHEDGLVVFMPEPKSEADDMSPPQDH